MLDLLCCVYAALSHTLDFFIICGVRHTKTRAYIYFPKAHIYTNVCVCGKTGLLYFLLLLLLPHCLFLLLFMQAICWLGKFLRSNKFAKIGQALCIVFLFGYMRLTFLFCRNFYSMSIAVSVFVCVGKLSTCRLD